MSLINTWSWWNKTFSASYGLVNGGDLIQNTVIYTNLLGGLCLFDCFSVEFCSILFYENSYTDKPPSCTTFKCKTSDCIKEPTLNCTFIKISEPWQVFPCDGQNHIMSYETTNEICAKGSVYRKHSNILIFHLWRWLLIFHHRKNQSCTLRRFACNNTPQLLLGANSI